MLALLLSACAATIRVELPPTPAVRMPVDQVAVVARERRCQPAADALTQELGRSGWTVVVPSSQVKLVVFSCGDHEQLLLEH